MSGYCFKYLCCITIYVIYVILMACEDQRNNKKKSMKPSRPAGTECEAVREVGVDLQGSDLWKRFHEIGTEMIITKAGR